MKADKRKRLEARGWKVGGIGELLALDDAEVRFIELKARVAIAFAARRKLHGTQTAAAATLKSSQSRVAKMERGDASVSLDLLVRGLLALGATDAEVTAAFAGKHRRAPR